MNRMKRLWSLMLAAALMITLLPAMAFAEDVSVPVSAKWIGEYPLRGVIGYVRLQNLETPDLAAFEVTFSNNDVKEYTYLQNEDGTGAFYVTKINGQTVTADRTDPLSIMYACLDDWTPGTPAFRDGENPAVLALDVPYTDGDGNVRTESLNTDVTVYCWEDEHPRAVEFISSGGSVPTVFIGYNTLSEDMFYGSGNAFRVSGTGWDAETRQYEPYTRTYYYVKGNDADGEQVEGFFYKGKTTEERFTFEFTGASERYLSKGYHDLDAAYSKYNEDTGQTDTVAFRVRVNAARYDAYTDTPVYAYTGKAVKPKFRVYNSDGRKIPASAYTYKMPKNKKMGWYTVTIRFKDRNKYVGSVTASYGIGPAAPKLTRVSGKRNGLSVKWKRPTGGQLKNVDGMYIEVSTDKYFLNNYKRCKVSKKDLKKGYKNIGKLKKNRKYYVRAYSYKKIRQKGVKFDMPSADSKTLIKKTS